MEHGEEADLGAQVLGIGGDGAQGLGGGAEQNAVDHFLVLVGDGGNLFRHGKDHVEILACREVRSGDPRAIPRGPATGILGSADSRQSCKRCAAWPQLVALFEWPPRAAVRQTLDRSHDAALRDRQRSAVLLTIVGTVAAEHVRHFELRAVHRAGRSEILGCRRVRLYGDRTRKQVERTGRGAHLGGGDPQVAGGGRQAAMAEQQLNGAHVGAGFQQMDRECVAQRMRRDRLGDAGSADAPFGRPASTASLVIGFSGRSPGNSHSSGSHGAPPVAQRLQQLGREHDVAVLLALALLDTHHHALAVDLAGLQANGLGDAQAGGVAGGQDRPVLEALDATKKMQHLLGAEDDGQLLRRLGPG